MVTRFTLRSYIRSGWLLLDLVCVWFLYAVFFYEFGGDVPYFYSTTSQGLGALSIISTVIMMQRATKAQMYLPLARLTARGVYICGLLLATAVLRVLSFFLMLLLALGYHAHSPGLGIEGATISNMLPGALGLVLNCLILAALTVVLSVPIATRRIQILFLAWLAATLYSNTSVGIVAQYLSVVRAPLAPLLANYDLGTTASITGYSLLMLLLALGYIVGLTGLATWLFNRRDLILQ
jgi:hypothetical protein